MDNEELMEDILQELVEKLDNLFDKINDLRFEAEELSHDYILDQLNVMKKEINSYLMRIDREEKGVDDLTIEKQVEIAKEIFNSIDKWDNKIDELRDLIK